MNSSCIVVTGAAGQLGQTLVSQWADASLSDYQFIALDRSQLDIAKPQSIDQALTEYAPSVIVNAAAYTQVDGAESDQDSAYNVNERGVAALASWAAENHAQILHISTDFVFDGSNSTPYLPDTAPKPLGVYGASKLAGERTLTELASNNGAIIRTSWLYSEYGNNFVKTMLRLMAERDSLSVVNDQIGSATSTHSLARLIFAMIHRRTTRGIYHWTDGGNISWFEFAQEIQKQALELSLLENEIPLSPIATTEYPTPAKRPAYSVLDRNRVLDEFDLPTKSWQEELHDVLCALAN